MSDLAPIAIGTTARTGPSQWLAEAVATLSLILTILGGIRYAPQSIPWLVGLVITAAYWFTSSTSFANPAVKRSRFNHVATVCGWRPSTRAVCAIVRRACRRADATEHCGVLRLRS
jgi:glycerol uptake facilitator-like aquaporin